MCGIVAIFSSGRLEFELEKLKFFLESQKWRGPDNTGIWTDNSYSIFLGHNRLTILDPSPLANMPIWSKCKRFVMVYNGEIYNHKDLRKIFQLECVTHSDSETLINLYAQIGSSCLDYLEGMFSFVIYDCLTHNIVAARDQLGIKPLFYSKNSNKLVFGSEPAVISDIVGGTPSQIAINEWKIFRRPIAGKTFFNKVNEVPPGFLYESSTGLRRYWQPNKCKEGLDFDEFRQELVSSVRSQLLNDYETVSLLSGGLDSAVVLGLAGIKKSYTIGLPCNNEFEGAEESANKLGTSVVKI